MNQVKVLLVVEDEAMTAWLLSQSLRRLGYTVCGPVATGEAAVQTAADEQPDVVLMDIRLAGPMDGIEAAERITAQREVSVIFMTGYSDQEVRSRALAQRPAGYLVKPVTPEHIVPVLERLFEPKG
jgi:CheY-like chemotaxis protein